jgi:hypothetical protein
MTGTVAHAEVEAIKTYRYVRLAMVAMVVGLGASVSREAGGSGDEFLGSISAYYYTPARGIFVASLVAIGTCLVCVRGGSTLEDVLLNLAGLLAPVVAFVPTSPAKEVAAQFPTAVADREAAVANNFPALLVVASVGGIILLGLAVRGLLRSRAGAVTDLPTCLDVIGFVVTAAVVIFAWGWYETDEKAFLARAHYTAAIAMFLLIAIVAVLDGRHAIAQQGKKTRGWFYVAIGFAMLLGGGGILFYDWQVQPWDHAVLAAEALLIMLFGVFWAMQTVDLWHHSSRKHAIDRARAVAT